MGLFNQFPFTNFHDMNLDWLVSKTKENENSISTLQAAVKIIEDALVSVKPNPLKKDVFLCVGDSYGIYDIASKKHWPDYLKEKIGISDSRFYNLCRNGAGFNVEGNTFLTEMEDFIREHESDAGAITKILIVGGLNDSNIETLNGLSAAIVTFMTYAKTWFPNATIYIGYAGYSGNATTWQNRLAACNEYARATADGALYMSGLQYVLHDTSLMYSDEIHPNDEGSVVLANAIYSCLSAGSCTTVYKNKQIPIVIEGGTITALFANITNNVLSLNTLEPLIITFNSPKAIAPQSLVQLGTFSPTYFYSAKIDCMIRALTSTGDSRYSQGVLNFVDGIIQLYVTENLETVANLTIMINKALPTMVC